MDKEGIRDLRNYVGGCFVEQDGSEWMDVLEPATGERFARLPLSGSNDVDAAVEAAREAQPGWAALGKDSRADWLDRIADSLEASFEEVAELESRDTGKPISLARAVDANRSVANFRFFAGLIREAGKRDLRDGRRHELRGQQARRSRCPDYPLEPASLPTLLEGGSCHRNGKHSGVQAKRAHPDDS